MGEQLFCRNDARSCWPQACSYFQEQSELQTRTVKLTVVAVKGRWIIDTAYNSHNCCEQYIYVRRCGDWWNFASLATKAELSESTLWQCQLRWVREFLRLRRQILFFRLCSILLVFFESFLRRPLMSSTPVEIGTLIAVILKAVCKHRCEICGYPPRFTGLYTSEKST